MKETLTLNSKEEFDKLVVDNIFKYDGDVEFKFDLNAPSVDIKARNMKAKNIDAWDIKANNIDANNIDANNIDAWDIDARDIKAGDIKSNNIKTRDIKAGDIDAENINARDINYYASCIAYESFTCKSVKGERRNSIHKCLDGEIVYKDKPTGEI